MSSKLCLEREDYQSWQDPRVPSFTLDRCESWWSGRVNDLLSLAAHGCQSDIRTQGSSPQARVPVAIAPHTTKPQGLLTSKWEGNSPHPGKHCVPSQAATVRTRALSSLILCLPTSQYTGNILRTRITASPHVLWLHFVFLSNDEHFKLMDSSFLISSSMDGNENGPCESLFFHSYLFVGLLPQPR